MGRTAHPNSEPQVHEKRNHRRINWILVGFLLIAGYFLATEHRAHAVQYLPLLLLLLCPVLHLLHNHGGGNHDGGDMTTRNKEDHHA
jgi:hypothetical protein